MVIRHRWPIFTIHHPDGKRFLPQRDRLSGIPRRTVNSGASKQQFPYNPTNFCRCRRVFFATLPDALRLAGGFGRVVGNGKVVRIVAGSRLWRSALFYAPMQRAVKWRRAAATVEPSFYFKDRPVRPGSAHPADRPPALRRAAPRRRALAAVCRTTGGGRGRPRDGG
jgi:hypothetical protein